eukprot:TRINITY_DN6704_c0_g1_i7.p1 TRINITY_DN6704_c0_g1~~TRINITY_DN6704_c0_g1_i7.p1  ORF type:complete len:791 (+),score=200.01 TRINITY_DN6704_c0_g1_i7:516-2888(+)
MTRQTLNLIYRKEVLPAFITIVFSLDEQAKHKEETNFELSPEQTFYYWNRFLHWLGNHNNIQSPITFALACSGITNLVSTYMEVHQPGAHWVHPRDIPPPTANKVLDVLGKWLFEAVLIDRPNFEDGTSIATSTLCKIFCELVNVEPIHPRYLATFYTCIGKILLKKGSSFGKVITSLFNNSKRIFTRELPGVNTLIPHYLYAIAKAWSEGPAGGVGLACAEILLSVASYPNRYRNGVFYSLVPDDNPVVNEVCTKYKVSPLRKYEDMYLYFKIILRAAISHESSIQTLQVLLSCLTQVSSEMNWVVRNKDKALTSKQDIEWMSEMINIILSKLKSNAWVGPVIFKAFELLSFFRIHIIKDWQNNGKIAEKVIQTLVKFICERVNVTEADIEIQRLVCYAYQTIRDWIAYDDQGLIWFTQRDMEMKRAEPVKVETKIEKPEVMASPGSQPTIAALPASINTSPNQLQQPTTTSQRPKSNSTSRTATTVQMDLIKAIVMGLSSTIPMITGAAQMCLNYLLNINDTVDGFSTSCTADEIDFLYHFAEREGFITKDPQELYNRYKNYLRFFILDEKIIISVMDFPAIQGGPPSSVIIVRNEVGKFIWKAELTLFANHEIETPDSAITVIPPPLTSKPLYDYSYKSPKLPGPLEDSFNWFEEYSLKRKEASVLEEKAKILNANEQNYLQTVSFGLKKDITYQVPRLLDIWGGASKVLHSRILLTHLGFMVPRNIDRISLLESQYQLLNTLKSLDKISEREPVVASVVYFKKNQRTISEIFSQNQDDASSLDFKS